MRYIDCGDVSDLEVGWDVPERIKEMAVEEWRTLNPNKQCCYDCKFFQTPEPINIELIDADKGAVVVSCTGSCQRWPPVFLPELAKACGYELDSVYWPTVHADFWCGEFVANVRRSTF